MLLYFIAFYFISVDAGKCRSVGLKIANLHQKQGNLLQVHIHADSFLCVACKWSCCIVQAALCWLADAGEGEDRATVLGDAVSSLAQLVCRIF